MVLVRSDGPGRSAWAERVCHGEVAVATDRLPRFGGTVGVLGNDTEPALLDPDVPE